MKSQVRLEHMEKSSAARQKGEFRPATPAPQIRKTLEAKRRSLQFIQQQRGATVIAQEVVCGEVLTWLQLRF